MIKILKNPKYDKLQYDKDLWNSRNMTIYGQISALKTPTDLNHERLTKYKFPFSKCKNKLYHIHNMIK